MEVFMKGTHTLMHKGEKVATCSFDANGYLKSISKIHNPRLLPPCVKESNPTIDLQRWILTRSIAPNRKDVASYREFYGSSAFLSSIGLSLFDCYWFANEEHKDWEKENAYDNWDYKTDGLYLMLFHPERLPAIDTTSPNLTIPGSTQRMWYRFEGDLCLLNGNAQKEMADYKFANENPVVDSRSYAILSGQVYVMTKASTNKDIERISLEDLYNAVCDPRKTKMENLQACCENFGIQNWKDFFSSMMQYDNATGNDSRELCDIGVLRNTSTLEIIDFAKI